jgi:pyrroline-5-carboxylate reductase
VATRLATQTLLGASTLLDASDDSAADLRAAVTSPGGTTAAGLHVLEQRGLRAAFLDAISAAAARGRELG